MRVAQGETLGALKTERKLLSNQLLLARSASEGFREIVEKRVELDEVQEFFGIPSLALRANSTVSIAAMSIFSFPRSRVGMF